MYAAVAVAIILWDAYIGFGFEFPNIEDGPNAICAGLLWPIGLPVILLIIFSMRLEKAKSHRLERAREKRRLRIEAEVEQKVMLDQIEKEITHVEAKAQNAR